MADLGSFGRVNLSQLGSLGRVNVASIGSINKIQVVSSVPDSITLDAYQMFFYSDGSPTSSNRIYITASGSWYADYIDTGYGVFFSCYPESASGNRYVTIYCDINDGGFERYGRIRFWRGSVYAELDITQYNYM